jgi:predicted DNA-binding helix-hairpin-helix protein
VDQMYTDWNLKRVYYPPFRPAWDTPMQEHPPTPAAREHRLYQMDWLRRVYGFESSEIDLAFDNGGFLSLEQDPKTVIAMENLDAFPMDLNVASKERLLRIPGIGPVSAERIIRSRRRHTVDSWRDLQAMGVVRKRAWPYVVFPGQRPPSGKQLRMDLFGEAQDRRVAESEGMAVPPVTSPLLRATLDAAAPAGEPKHACVPGSKGAMCAGCPINPGSLGA